MLLALGRDAQEVRDEADIILKLGMKTAQEVAAKRDWDALKMLEPAMKDTLKIKTTYHYILWWYILENAEAGKDEEIRVLRELLNLNGLKEMPKKDVAAEIASLWVKLSTFFIHNLPTNEKIDLDTVLNGLKRAKLLGYKTEKVVTFLYDYMEGGYRKVSKN